MLTKRHQNSSTERLLTPVTTTTAPSIEDLCIPPLNLQTNSSYIDEHSSSSASITDRKSSFVTATKTNKLVLASADIHKQLTPPSDSSNMVKEPIAAPRRSLTSAFEFSQKHDKNLANIQRQEHQYARDDNGSIGAATTTDNSDSTPLVEVAPRRVRPKSAKPSKEPAHRNRLDKHLKLPTVYIENESSNSMQSDLNEKLLRRKKKRRSSGVEREPSHSDVSYVEKNEYELKEISSPMKDKGQENLAYDDNEHIVQETVLNFDVQNRTRANNGSDGHVGSGASSKSKVSDQGKSKMSKKRGHRRTKSIDSNKIIENTDGGGVFSTIIGIKNYY